jgi:CheY-like chemotaxis protein/HPt (histidine-containing phosphotransfer) domain-containing protein
VDPRLRISKKNAEKPIGTMKFRRKLTRRELEEKAKATEVADRATRARSEFLANISHEIRTPMNAIVGMAELLLRTELAQEQKKFATTIHSSAEALLAILNDLLDFSKIEAGKLKFENLEFNLSAAIDQTIDLLSQSAKTKGLDLKCTLAPDVPTGVRGDPGRLRQVLTNLIGNAIKFTERGAVTLSVKCQQRKADSVLLRFCVTDTGTGIPAEVLPKLFHAFTQADTSTARKFGGTGLGLVICKDLVTRMGGTIDVMSMPGVGSDFFFTARFEVNASAELASPEAKAAPLHLPSSAKVLIVEDNPINREIARLQLRDVGVNPTVVSSGLEALRAMEDTGFDLVLMDCQMPDMDGYEAAREIRKREASGRRTPIVAMTANAGEGDRALCLQAGMDDFLTKPVRIADLVATLSKWLTASKEAPVLDLEVISELRRLDHVDEKSVVAELGEALLGAVPGVLEEMRKAVESGNLELPRKRAHALKASSGNLGAKRFSDLCAELEQTSDIAKVRELIPRLEKEFTELKGALGAEIAKVA